MNRHFIYIAIIVSAFACRKKEKIVEVEKEVIVFKEDTYKWKRVYQFEANQMEYVKNARRISGGYIFFTTASYDAVYDSSTNKFSILDGSYRDLQLKPLITDAYKVEMYKDAFNVVPHNNLPDYPIAYSEKQIYLKSIDSNFIDFHLGGTIFEGEVSGNKNTLFFTYYSKVKSMYCYMAIRLNFYLPALNSGSSYIQTEKTKTFRNDFGNATNRLIGAIGNNLLFVMGSNKNYLLNANLDTLYIGNSFVFNDLFTSKNATYSFAGGTGFSGANAGKTCLLKTTDEGLTWQVVVCGLQMDFQNCNYIEIGDKIIAFSRSQLWEIIVTDNGVVCKELINDGLANKKIIAITMSNNRVFISTESGVFERSYNEFIEYK